MAGFVDGMISDRKQLMENMAMHRQPVELSESGGDVITFLLPHHNPTSCVLAGQLEDCCNSPTETESGRLL